MLLTNVKVKNYLSINGECEFPVDAKVTVLLGANDHGKSNLLRTLEHLNFQNPISSEDENWDNNGVRLEFTFQLQDEDWASIQGVLDDLNEELNVVLAEEADDYYSEKDLSDEEREEGLAAEAERVAALDRVDLSTLAAQALPIPVIAASSTTAVVNPMPVPAPPTPSQPMTGITPVVLAAPSSPPLTSPKESSPSDLPFSIRARPNIQDEMDFVQELISNGRTIRLVRDGVAAPLSLLGRSLETLEESIDLALANMIPRVELFKAFSGELQDSITADEIKSDDAEFLQGIFYYAGLDPMDCEQLFQQNDETDKTLEEASRVLDEALRDRWAQGVDLDLHFQLKHRNSSIELLVKDPAVKKRHARMSKRSSGVTQFFRLSMALHARRKKNPSNSYIYVFDEPGVFLHPKGQKDLLSVFEQLAQDTQIVFATHSLFMLNQNFPERHRLITKSSKTTLVDSKPYRANWKYAVDALGVKLTANILFSPNILLVEGDSDPIYLYEMIRVLNQRGDIDVDANLLGIMSYGDLTNLRFLLQTFKTESNERLLAVLFEGDSQGKTYEKQISNLLTLHEVKAIHLESGSAIEDYCLHPTVFLDAAEETIRGSLEATDAKAPKELRASLEESWNKFLQHDNRGVGKEKKKAEAKKDSHEPIANQDADRIDESMSNAGSWFKTYSAMPPINGSSKVALARNYVFKSRESDPLVGVNPKRLALARKLANEIAINLKLPSARAKQQIEA